jgi:hypothetical protein
MSSASRLSLLRIYNPIHVSLQCSNTLHQPLVVSFIAKKQAGAYLALATPKPVLL